MISIFVKHYLNSRAVDYFNNIWFPAVEEAISSQQGFISIETFIEHDNSACMNIKLKFSSAEALDLWVQQAIHDDLVHRLDDYRISAWAVATVEHSETDLISENDLQWTNIELPYNEKNGV